MTQVGTFEDAAERLRRAVPLMVQYKVPVTPINYALWFSYVGDDRPALKSRMDALLKTYGTCPDSVGDALFREHYPEYTGDDTRQLSRELEQLVGALSGDVTQLRDGTESLGETLDACSRQLTAPGTAEGLEALVETLARETSSVRATAGAVGRHLDEAEAEIARLRRELERAKSQALNDALTGLANRRAFDADLAQISRAPAAPGQLCLVLADVDHFKKFNDTFGHALGDQVLKLVASVLNKGASEQISAYRYGGEEFALLCMTGPELAGRTADTLRGAIEKLRLKDKKSGAALSHITASFGVAALQPDEAVDALIERADKALYRAKEGGRNQVVLAD